MHKYLSMYRFINITILFKYSQNEDHIVNNDNVKEASKT